MGDEESRTEARGEKRHARFLRLRLRVLFYLVIVLVILFIRFLPTLRPHLPRVRLDSLATKGFVLTGADLAPLLTEKLLADYHARYPEIDVTLRPGGTAQALEALINKQCDVAFLSRPPTAEEQTLFRQTLGDTVPVFPVALGGIVLVAPLDSPMVELTVEELKALLSSSSTRSSSTARIERIYVPDPNLGLWDAVTALLELNRGASDSTRDSTRLGEVIFLADQAAVFDATAKDPASLGFASTLVLPEDLSARALRVVRIQGALAESASTPGEEEIATGDYPLYHHLYVSCRPDGGIQGSMFVTYLYSGRGQRLVKRLGFLPAREVAREVILTTTPIGKTN